MIRLTLLGAVSALALAACGDRTTDTATPAPPPVDMPAAQPTTMMSDSDFMAAVAASDAFEIQAAELAAQRASAANVKSFAERMRTDHTNTTRELTQLASTQSMAAPQATLTPQQNANLAALRNAEGATFDALYMQQQVDAHRQAVQMFETYSNNAADGPLKNWAQSTLPALRAHLEMAQEMQPPAAATTGGTATTPGAPKTQ